MKSSIITLTDYKKVPVNTEIVISPLSENEIEKKIHALSRSRKEVIHPDTIQKGDAVVLTLQSENPRFNKKMLPVAVGSGLFDKDFEQMLIGLKSGETEKIHAADSDITVTVRSITRTIFPEPTKEEIRSLAESLDPPQNFSTVSEYTEYLQREHKHDQRESAIYEIMQDILDGVLTTSDWAFDEGEVAEQYSRSIAELDEQAKQDLGKSYDELTDDDIKANIGPDNRADLEQQMHDSAESLIASALFFGHLKGISPENLNLDDEDIMDYSILEAYVRSIITYKEA